MDVRKTVVMDVIDECLRFKRRVLADLVKQFMNSLGRDPQVLWNPTHVHTYTNQQKWFRQSKSKNKVNHNGRKVSLIFYSLNVKSFPHTLLPLPTSFLSPFSAITWIWLYSTSGYVKKAWRKNETIDFVPFSPSPSSKCRMLCKSVSFLCVWGRVCKM